MPANRESLLAGRNGAPLDPRDVRRAINTFLGLDRSAPVRYEEGARTAFRVIVEEVEEIVEIVFGPDLYPGIGVTDPNSSLSMQAAAAHELSHYYRWRDRTEIANEQLFEIDEALTSLEAILRFPRELSDHDIRQLVADAIQRLQIFSQKPRTAPVQALGS
jgi:hypothetical protein